MAVRWQVENERGSIYKFALEDIVVRKEDNGRHDVPNIEELILDIEKRGQDTPVTVRNEGGKPVLVFGYQRYRAIAEINRRNPDLAPRPILAVFKQLTPFEAFQANVQENRMRSGVTPIDDAYNMKRMMNVYGLSERQVVEFYSPTSETPKAREDAQRWVRERLALIGLTPAAEKAVRAGRVKLHTAIKLNKLDPAKQETLVAKEGRIKGSDVEAALNRPAPIPRLKREPVNEAPKTPSPSYLALQMVNCFATFLHEAHLKGKPVTGLMEFCDGMLDAAAQASVHEIFDGATLEAMEAYRKSRIA